MSSDTLPTVSGPWSSEGASASGTLALREACLRVPAGIVDEGMLELVGIWFCRVDVAPVGTQRNGEMFVEARVAFSGLLPYPTLTT